jgi:hypothetical protein
MKFGKGSIANQLSDEMKPVLEKVTRRHR